MKAFFVIITLLTCTISYSQNQKFKAQVFIGDSSLVSGGVVIFPLTKDTLEIGNSDSAIIDLNNFENRVFYFLWSGWKSKVFRFDDNNYSNDFTKVYVPDTIFYRIYEEIHICPICLKSKNVIPIKYGMPTQRMLVQAKHKKIRLEGCLKTEEIAKFYCKVDDFEF
jgi:hypothetical protein